MKIVTIAGNCGKDAELKTTQAGDHVAQFSVAVSGREDSTTWFDVSVWGKRAKALQPHIKKGDKITVCGDLSTREHEGKTYLKVNANEITLQGGKPSDGQRDNSGGDYAGASGGNPSQGGGFDDDSIPFAPCIW